MLTSATFPGGQAASDQKSASHQAIIHELDFFVVPEKDSLYFSAFFKLTDREFVVAGAFVSEREQIIRFSSFHYSQFTQAERVRRIEFSLNTFDVVNVKVNSAEVVFNWQSFIFDSFRKCEALGESFSVDFDLEPAHRMGV